MPIKRSSPFLDQLSLINCMYQYSLEWTGGIYMSSIDNSEKFDNIGTRISEIKTHFSLNLFENICQGLLEDDRWLFAFLLAKNAAQVGEELFMAFLKANPLKCKNMEDRKGNIAKAAEM